MSDEQYEQYKNLHIFAKEWRKYKQVSPMMSKSDFRKDIQFNHYTKLEFAHAESGKPVLIYLLATDSKYANSSQDLKRLLAKIKDPSDVILVSYLPFKTYSLKTINSFKHLRVKMYRHENFAVITPKGPLCYPHRIMTREEVNTLLNEDLCSYLTNQQKILEEDPQCIWIGAEVGDVIRIDALSDISGKTIQYRVVVPKSGKIVSFRPEKSEVKEDEKNNGELEDEDIQEYREDAKNENENNEEEEDENE